MTSPPGKACRTCEIIRPASDYRKQRCQCRICDSFTVREKRRDIKRWIIESKGGVCESCGFVGPPSVYDLHHRDPKEKDRPISQISSFKKAAIESEKCDLLCANCHRILHAESG